MSTPSLLAPVKEIRHWPTRLWWPLASFMLDPIVQEVLNCLTISPGALNLNSYHLVLGFVIANKICEVSISPTESSSIITQEGQTPFISSSGPAFSNLMEIIELVEKDSGSNFLWVKG